MQPISRRALLGWGGAGVVAVLAGGVGLTLSSITRPTVPGGGADLVQPREVHRADGELSVRLRAATSRVRIGEASGTVLAYNETLPGPTLRLRAGDRLRIALENRLDSATNLHVHGLHVSPAGAGDNPLRTIPPGGSFDYDYRVPKNHPPGIYWYHPHHHGSVADQVFAGLYGAIVIEDPVAIEVARERVLLISDISLDALGRVAAPSPMDRMLGREGSSILVNGQLNPRLAARPGERERWRIVNACVSRYLRLQLDGQRMQVLGIDSGRLALPQDVNQLVLAPGNRGDLLITVGTGDSALRALPYDRGGRGMTGGRATARRATDIATFHVAGDPVIMAPPVPPQESSPDLRGAPVSARRDFTFEMGMGAMMRQSAFTINGRAFDPDRVDLAVNAGSVEEWTLINPGPLDHPIHLHVWPMQLVVEDVAGLPRVRDVVNVPAFGRVKVLIGFDDFTGRTVFHCHILDHEDNGMMAVVDVR